MLVRSSYFALIVAGLGLSLLLTELGKPVTSARFTISWKDFTEIPPQHYIAYYTSEPIIIDGSLNDRVWEKIPWSEPFQDIEGSIRPKPTFQTRMKMCFDDQNIYIAARLEEPDLWATYTKHDCVIFEENDFEVFIDPDGDNFQYGELELNALNTTWDLFLPKPYKDGGSAENAWEIAGLKTAVKLEGTLNAPKDHDTAWTVEIAWPFQSWKGLTTQSLPPKKDDLWRINFSRVEWDKQVVDNQYQKIKGRPEHNWIWSPQGVIDMHRPEHWGYVQFSREPIGTAKLQADPTLPYRWILHRIYYAQRQYYARFGRYAMDLNVFENLQIAPEKLKEVSFTSSSKSFHATMVIPSPNDRKKITIDQSSHIVVK